PSRRPAHPLSELLQHLGLHRAVEAFIRPGVRAALQREQLGIAGGAAIDGDALAGDEAGRRGQQEHDRRRNLRLLRQALQRHRAAQLGDEFLLEALVVIVQAAGRNPAGRDRVDAYTGVGPLDRGGLGEVEHAGARRAGVAHAGHAAPHVGQHVDDGAAALAHRLIEDLARHQEAAGEVVGDHRLPTLLADGHQRRRELAAGVVDQAVDHAAPGGDGLYRLLHRILVADIESLHRTFAAVLADLGGRGLQLLQLAAGQHHMSAERGQFVGGAAADAGAAAGDDDGLALEQVRGEDGTVMHVYSRTVDILSRLPGVRARTVETSKKQGRLPGLVVVLNSLTPSFLRKPESRKTGFSAAALDTGFRRYDDGFDCCLAHHSFDVNYGTA